MKLTRRQIRAIENLTHAGGSLNNGVYTMPDGNSFLAICGYSFAIIPGEVPDGKFANHGYLTDLHRVKQILDKYREPVGDIVVNMPTREELQAYIEINKQDVCFGYRKFTKKMRNRVKPYPLNNGEFLASPFYLLDMVDILPGATVKTAGPDQPFYFQDGDALGMVMPVRFSERTDVPELLKMAEEARQAASYPKTKKEKPDNQGQPTNFRQLKNAILDGSIVEVTNRNGKTGTANSLFNGMPTVLCISGVGASKYWDFRDGYCLNYWDDTGFYRGYDDIRFKLRILGPMPKQSEEEKAQEQEKTRKYDEEYEARIAAEKKARQEAEERERLKRLDASAQKIEAAKQAFTKNGDDRLPRDLLQVVSEEYGVEEARIYSASPLYAEALGAAKRARLHAKKIALRHYEKWAYITPENAVHIREQIDRLKNEIERLQDETETTTDTS